MKKLGGYCVGRGFRELMVLCVISTPVILNGGYIYTLPSLKEGNVCAYMYACVVDEIQEKEPRSLARLFFLGFLGIVFKHYYRCRG